MAIMNVPTAVVVERRGRRLRFTPSTAAMVRGGRVAALNAAMAHACAAGLIEERDGALVRGAAAALDGPPGADPTVAAVAGAVFRGATNPRELPRHPDVSAALLAAERDAVAAGLRIDVRRIGAWARLAVVLGALWGATATLPMAPPAVEGRAALYWCAAAAAALIGLQFAVPAYAAGAGETGEGRAFLRLAADALKPFGVDASRNAGGVGRAWVSALFGARYEPAYWYRRC
jgi:hypothetical protein